MTHSRKGVTLIELLITIIIGAIAMMALSVPFMTERIFWLGGTAQAESQRDAQMGARAIARAARQSTQYNPFSGSAGWFASPAAGVTCFQGGPTFNNGSLYMYTSSGILGCAGAPTILIDGNAPITRRSQVQVFSMTEIVDNKLVRVHLDVLHTRGSRQENEVVDTDIFLRNGT